MERIPVNISISLAYNKQHRTQGIVGCGMLEKLEVRRGQLKEQSRYGALIVVLADVGARHENAMDP